LSQKVTDIQFTEAFTEQAKNDAVIAKNKAKE
jgi:hypothetical protein